MALRMVWWCCSRLRLCVYELELCFPIGPCAWVCARLPGELSLPTHILADQAGGRMCAYLRVCACLDARVRVFGGDGGRTGCGVFAGPKGSDGILEGEFL